MAWTARRGIDTPPCACNPLPSNREGNEKKMKFGTSGTRSNAQVPAPAAAPGQSPARAYEDMLDVARQHHDPYASLAVRALSVLVLSVGAFLLLLMLIQRSYGPLTLLGQSRTLMGACLVAGGGLAFLLARRAWSRASATLSLTLSLLALMLHAWHSGLGTHSIVLGGAVLLVAVSGMLVNLPTAGVLGVVATALMRASRSPRTAASSRPRPAWPTCMPSRARCRSACWWWRA